MFIMIQSFEPIGLPAAEKIQGVCIKVHLKSIPEDRHEAVDRCMLVRPVMRQHFDTLKRSPNTGSATQGGFL